MKKSPLTGANPAVIALLLSVIFANAIAQKLPNVQQTSARAPADIKIDGTLAEWNNTLQAHNRATDIFYTIANDDNNLYMVIQATTPHCIDKILSGGVTLTIKPDSKDKAVPVAITYPLLTAKGRSGIINKLKDESTNMNVELANMNSQLTTDSKEIKIEGVKEIPDTLISVYNEQGIKTAMRIDSNKAYTYELALPLKYLKQIIGSNNKLNYNLKLNGLNIKTIKIVINGMSANASSPAVMNLVSDLSFGGGNNEMQDLTNPTDFSGNYILAK